MEEFEMNETTKIERIKGFVVQHKTKFAVAGTALMGMFMLRNQHKLFAEFLEENDMTDKFNEYLLDGEDQTED